MKIDGDIIYDASVSYKIERFLLSPDTDMYFSLSGVNLIDNHEMLFCPSNSPFCGMNDDLCVFPVSEKNIYKHRPEFEYLDLTGLRKYGHCFAFYHMKFVKNDMGFGNYLLYDNPNSRYVKITKEFIIGLRFLDLVTVLKSNNILLRIPCELNIKASENRSYKLIYKEKLRDAGIDITIGNILACYFSRIKTNPIKFIRSLVNR